LGGDSAAWLTELDAFPDMSTARHWRSTRVQIFGKPGSSLSPEDTDPGPELNWRWRATHSPEEMSAHLFRRGQTCEDPSLVIKGWGYFWDFERFWWLTEGRVVRQIPWPVDIAFMQGPWGIAAKHLQGLECPDSKPLRDVPDA
jgi:hypothetical protein